MYKYVKIENILKAYSLWLVSFPLGVSRNMQEMHSNV